MDSRVLFTFTNHHIWDSALFMYGYVQDTSGRLRTLFEFTFAPGRPTRVSDYQDDGRDPAFHEAEFIDFLERNYPKQFILKNDGRRPIQ